MNGFDRFRCVSKGILPDRVPVICNLLDQGAKELGIPIMEYYSRGEYVADGQLKLRKKYGYDVLWGFFYTAHIAQMLGCQSIYFSNEGPPNVGHLVIPDFNDIDTFQVPEDFTESTYFKELIKCIRILKKEDGYRYPVLSVVISCYTLPSILMGMEKWFELLFFGPVLLRDKIISKCCEFNVKYVSALRKAGVDFFAYSNPMGSTDMVDPEFFKRTGLCWLRKEMEQLGIHDLIYFCGGYRINRTIDLILEKTGLTAYYIHPMDDIKEAKRIIGGRGLCVGTINDIQLIDWTAKEIESEVKKIMMEGTQGKGAFLFGTLPVPYMIPDEKIKIMLDAAYKYGDYSLKPPS